MVIARQPLSLEEFLRLPEEEPPLEYENGVVTQKMSPEIMHAAIQAAFTARVDAFAVAKRLARAFPELRVTFAGRSVVPDVAVFRWDRVPVDANGRLRGDVTIPPDVAVEIVSPEQSVRVLMQKCLHYVANGVPLALLLNPEDEMALLFRSNAVPLTLRGDDGIDLSEVLPGFELTVGQVFEALRHE